jgi:hypothetical protein
LNALWKGIHDAYFVLIACSHYLSKCVIILKLAKVYMFRVFKIMYSLLVYKIFSRAFVIKFASYRKLSIFLSLFVAETS